MISKEQLEELYVNQNLGTPAIGELLGINRGSVYFLLKEYGMLEDGKSKGQRIFDKKYKGTKTLLVNGYIEIRVPQEDGKCKRMLEHRYVMEQHIGRPLTSQEEIHHINGKKTDNRIENLQLMTKHTHQTKHRLFQTEDMFQWIYEFEHTHGRRPKSSTEFTEFTFQTFRDRFNHKAEEAWQAYEQYKLCRASA